MYKNFFRDEYIIDSVLGENKNNIVYKAFSLNDKSNIVAIKILKNEGYSQRLDDLIRFQSEAEKISGLSHPGIIKLLEFGEKDNVQYIITEFFDGLSLKDFIEQNRSSITDISLEIILRICSALEYIHDRNIIHRDLKPANILIRVNQKGKILEDLKIIDFGLSRIKKMNANDPVEMIGTISYISPEQTGLLKKQPDERSDLYSLGIIFYQLLAGRLPFDSDNINTLIHHHISKKPESLKNFNNNIPYILEKMILKLLEKDPDDRYQSAKGFMNDLLKFKNGSVDFIPGMEDRLTTIHYRSRFVGHEDDLEKLKNGFGRMLENKGGLYLLGGEAGVGKSRIVEEFKEYATSNGKIFIEGKSFSGKNKKPYGPFTEMLNGYLKYFLYHSNSEKTAIKDKLKKSTNELGEVILKLNPRMKEVIDVISPIVSIDPEREHNRFILISGKFFIDLSDAENGMIIFIDDLQWLDDGSFEILEKIIENISGSSLMIIGTYRNDEIKHGDKLLHLKETASSNGYPLTEINVISLNQNGMNKFISGILHSTGGSIEEISDFVFEKSRGNPFFSIEILKQMMNEMAIFNNADRWEIDVKKLNKMEVFSNVIDILIKRISLLNEDEIRVLSYASVIGRKFDMEILIRLFTEHIGDTISDRDIVRVVEKAKSLQLLEDDMQTKNTVQFVHDRVRDAFYLKTDDLIKREIHDKIGMVLESIRIDTEEMIFDLAYHFIEAGNEKKIKEYAYMAGIKAKEKYANDEAIKYFEVLNKTLMTNTVSDQWLKINRSLTDLYLITSKVDEAINLSEKLLFYEKSDIEKAEIYRQIGNGYFKLGNFEECEKNLNRGLNLLGKEIPLKKIRLVFYLLKEIFVHILFNFFFNTPVTIKSNTNNAMYMEIFMFYKSLNWLYILSDVSKFIYNILHMFHFTFMKLGNSKELGFVYAAYASMCMMIPLKKRSKKYFLISLKMLRKFKDRWNSAQALEYYGFYLLWDDSNYNRSINIFNKSMDIFTNIGDIWEIGMCHNGLGLANYFKGNYCESIRHFEEYLRLSKTNKNNYGIVASLGEIGRNYIELGEYDKAKDYIMQTFDISSNNNIVLNLCIAYNFNGILEIEKEHYKEGIESLEKSKYLYENNNFIKEFTSTVYPYLAEALIERYKSMKLSKKEKKDILSEIRKNIIKAKQNTATWLNSYSITLRVLSKYYEILHKNKKSEKYFLKSIALSGKIGRRYELAKSHYEFGNFLKNLNRKIESIKHYKNAFKIFYDIGSKKYTEKIKSLIEFDVPEDLTLLEMINNLKNIKMPQTILNLMKKIITTDDKLNLIVDVMEELLELLNAQRGWIFLKKADSNNLELIAGKSSGMKEIPQENFSIGIIYDVLNTGETMLTLNTVGDEKFSKYESIIKNGIKSILCFPIMHKNSMIGLCYFDNRMSSFSFSKEKIEMISIITVQLILSIKDKIVFEKKNEIEFDEKYFYDRCNKFDFTNRETDILLLLIKGYTNKEISDKCFISINTVRTHLARIYQKTDTSDREELIKLLVIRNKIWY